MANAISSDRLTIKDKTKMATQNDLLHIRNEVNIAIDSVGPFFDWDPNQSFTIIIEKKGICMAYAKKREIHIPLKHIQNYNAAIVHEMAHIMTQRHFGKNFFREGLAVYFQERYGNDCAYPNMKCLDIDSTLAVRNSEIIPFDSLIINPQFYYYSKGAHREMALMQAGSFTDYLVASFGLNKLNLLYQSDTLDYEPIYKKNLSELELDWLHLIHSISVN